MDQSWPHLQGPVKLFGPDPISVNASINNREFPVKMISSKQVLLRFAMVDRSAVVTKVDWADAYKHCPVHPEDLHLNTTMVGGRALVETSLTFGGVTTLLPHSL